MNAALTPALTPALHLAAVALTYWLLDIAIRRQTVMSALGLARRPRARLIAWILITLAAAAIMRWHHVPDAPVARLLMTGLTALLAWKVVTEDIDPVTDDRRIAERLALIGAAIGAWFNPALAVLALALLTRPFAQWRHHAILPIRALLAVLAHATAAHLLHALPIAPLRADMLVFFVLTLHASHYLSTAIAKASLGPRWSSWITDNRLHHLLASAYSWGWARFVPWPIWLRLIHLTARVERPAQALVFALELTAPLALYSIEAAWIFCAAWSAFHIGVVLLAGFWFWDWVGANLILALALTLLPPALADAAFGWSSVIAATLFIIAFPLRGRLWGPTALGWWDTPMTQRMYWRIEGASGRKYGLYNNFMCPHERLYGKVHGLFFAPATLITFHAGTVWHPDHRDAIHAAGPDPARLDAVRARHGITLRDERLATNHIAWLRRYLQAINRGAPKHILPRGLRWLKAPGSHLYSWGDLPPWRGQEPAMRCTLCYREEYFDGHRLVRLRDDEAITFDVDGDLPPCEPELSARATERMLMQAFWSAR